MTKTQLPAVKPPSQPTLIADLMEKQTERRFAIKSEQRAQRSIEAWLARTGGYHTGLEEKERKAIYKQVQALRKAAEKLFDQAGDTCPPVPNMPKPVADMLFSSYKSTATWTRLRDAREKEMILLARELPVCPWVKAQRGVAELGLAVIVAETGDLGGYSGPAKVWKRLGLACIDGTKQGSVPKDLAGKDRSEAWKARGYNPHRRAEVFAFIDDVMFRAQWRAAKDEDGKSPALTGKPAVTEAHPLGLYGEVYAERKAWNQARGLIPIHADRDARRFMAKRFIRDLWVAWQDALPVADDLAEAAE